MKCEYWHIDYTKKSELGKPSPTKHCENEAVGDFACDFIDAVVCNEHRCRCYKTCTAWTEEEMKEFLEAREERNKRWEEKRNKVVDNKK